MFKKNLIKMFRMIKVSLVFMFIGIFIFISSFGMLLPLSYRLLFFSSLVNKFSKIVLKIINVRLHVSKNKIDFNNSYLFVSNHLSYLDILVLASIFPSIFITSVEVENTFFLGYLAKLGGSIFIERRNRLKLKSEIEKVAKILEGGFNVILFPEGTTGKGDKVINFKKPFFMSAVNSEKNIVPVTINYRKIGNEKVNISNRDFICWYDDMTFLSHFISMIKQKSIEVFVVFDNEISVKENKDIKILSEKAFNCVNGNFIPVKTN